MKPSAYRSMHIARQGKTKKHDGNLKRWINEDWRNLTPYAENLVKTIEESPECGKPHPKQKGKSVCRPLKKINDSTPDIASSYTKQQIRKAVAIKNKGQYINWSKLRGGQQLTGGSNYQNLTALGYALGDDDIRRVLPDAKIIDYEALKGYNTIDELLPKDVDYVILLYEEKQNSGHWVTVLKYDGYIEFFCSYGTKPDGALKWVDYNTRKELGSDVPMLTNLFDSCPYDVIYNGRDFQSEDRSIATCGKWCVLRIRKMLEGQNLEEFQEWMEETKPKGMTYDEYCNQIYDK